MKALVMRIKSKLITEFIMNAYKQIRKYNAEGRGTMYNINKLDYFVGAFVSYIVSKNVAPALFDGTENSKIVEFTTNSDEYTVYLKYSTTVKKSLSKGKSTRKWDFIFTDKDMVILTKNKNNVNTTYVVLVCSEPNLKRTEIGIIEIKKALLCLGEDAVNKQKRLTITHQKGSPNLQIYGSVRDKQDAYRIAKNFDTYFKFERKYDNVENGELI